MDTCGDSILLTYVSLVVMLFGIMTGSIFGVASFSRWMFAPDSVIADVKFLGELGGGPNFFIKLILGVLILILFILAPNRHPHLFSLPPGLFL